MSYSAIEKTILFVTICVMCHKCDAFDAKKIPEIIQVTKDAFPDLQDYHKYYNSTLFQSAVVSYWWQTFDNEHLKPEYIVNQGELNRGYQSLNLSFSFPFYGHHISSVTIFTKGYVSTSPVAIEDDQIPVEKKSRKPAPIQPVYEYIAPFMANFIRRGKGGVEYKELNLPKNKRLLVVRWINVSSADQRELGKYSFMVIIEQGGKITFLYNKVPELPYNFVDEHHPVTIGLADAHRQKSNLEEHKDIILQYHSADLRRSRGINITADTAIVWEPLPTCSIFTTCEDCIEGEGVSDICFWCPTLGACSSSFDRLRPKWEEAGCHQQPLGSCPTEDIDDLSPMWTNTVEIDHDYYNVSIIQKDFNTLEEQMKSDQRSVVPESLLNNSRGSVRIQLPFPFPFYGHDISSIFLTTEGFISLADFLHSNMHLVQFIAPLRADFILNGSSVIRYLTTNDYFVVHWEDVTLEHDPDAGFFSFICKLSRTGEINFFYKNVPKNFTKLLTDESGTMHSLDDSHHGKVLIGISDAFQGENNDLHMYHIATVNLSSIANLTAVNFYPKPTCNRQSDCKSCVNLKSDPFPCAWCPSSSRCSSGIDRLRENWHNDLCHEVNVTKVDFCFESSKKPKVPLEREHQSYNSTIILDEKEAQSLWISSTKFRQIDRSAQILPSFPFRYFGEFRTSLTIEPRFGIISLAEFSRQDIPLEGSYIAPLMSVFEVPPIDSSQEKGESRISYLDDGNRFAVQWENVACSTSYSNRNLFDHRFSFQISISKSGEIIFVYKKVPIPINATTIPFPSAIKIGISDATAEDQPELFFRLSILRWQHSVDLTDSASLIRNNSAIRLTPLPTCADQSSCETCLRFPSKCGWCSGSQACSSSSERFKCQTAYISVDGKNSVCKAEKPAIVDQPIKVLPPFSDNHMYYRSVLKRDSEAYEHYLGNRKPEVVSEKMKLPEVRRIETTLEFYFPFYGHPIRKVVVMADGFLSLPTVLHSNMMETQYIAPLMARFDVDLLIPDSGVAIVTSNATMFSVEWKDMIARDAHQPSRFTFGVALKINGDITFVYEKVPFRPDFFKDKTLPVSFGLSDAYQVQRLSGTTINYKMVTYHTLDLIKHFDRIVGSGAVVILSSLPTCSQFRTCWECTTQKTVFDCVWCPALKRCSNTINGLDRQYQDWTNELCHLTGHSLRKYQQCPLEMVRTEHEFYNVTTHINPRDPIHFVKLSEAQTRRPDSNALNVEVDLPFVFRFYEMHFSRINISTFDAYATFVGEENVKAQIDVLRRPEIRPSLKNLASESVLFGSPSPDTFIVRWNKSFELVLYNSSVILFKYGAVPNDDENESRLVGIGFELESSSNTTFYRIDKSPEHHVRRGLVLRYDPLPSCRTLFSTCEECINSSMKCQWCGNVCQESFQICTTIVQTTDSCQMLSSSFSDVNFGPHHTAAVIGVLLILLGLGCSGVLFYGYFRPESKPGQLLNGLRLLRYSRFWERSSETESVTAASRRDSQITVISSITTL